MFKKCVAHSCLRNRRSVAIAAERFTLSESSEVLSDTRFASPEYWSIASDEVGAPPPTRWEPPTLVGTVRAGDGAEATKLTRIFEPGACSRALFH